jgi:hypothetical protein
MYRETKHILLAALMASALNVHAETDHAAATPVQVDSGASKFFTNPDEAAKALLEAVSLNDNSLLLALLNQQDIALLSSGDEVQDKNNRSDFVNLAKQKLQIEKIGEDKAIIHVGNDDWPFPIPVIKKADGWQFDPVQGRQEIVNRRIGRNELNTVAAMIGYMEAQFDYANADRDEDEVIEYAQKLQSEPGKFDGLFWETEEGDTPSPLGPLIAEARADGYKIAGESQAPIPYHGYYYRILTRQGKNAPGGQYDYIINGNMIAGFGLLAFPVQYGASGIMTFMMNHQGKIYQKDLGSKTAEVVQKIKEYNPDATWEIFQASE